MLRLGMTGIWIVVVLTTQVQAYSGGSGTNDDPYQIACYEDLVALAETPSDYGKSFILTADIDCNSLLPGRETDALTMIAPCDPTYNEPGNLGFTHTPEAFSGRFDGNGHVIQNLNRSGTDVSGLFGFVSGGAWIGRLGLEAVDLEGAKIVGALAVVVQSSCIVDCYSTGRVEGESLVGGLIGSVENSLILDCYSVCQVVGQLCTGGLAGEMESGLIQGCSSDVMIDSSSIAGGLVGYNVAGVVQACHATGQVTGHHWVGGLIGGQVAGAVRRCYSSVDVSGVECVGGLVGSQGQDLYGDESYIWSLIDNCYARGIVTGTKYIGGLVGYNVYPSVMSQCYSTGPVSGDVMVGGLVGEEGYEGYIVNCFWDVQSSGMDTSPAGTGLTTTLLLQQETFLSQGWDFVNETDNGSFDFWQMPTEGGTPVLVTSGGYQPSVTYTGQGTASDPYRINTVEQLLAIQLDPWAHYQLEQDLDLSDTIYTQALIPWFGGSLNGQGHAITGLSIEGVGYLGLFGMLTPHSLIESLTVTGVHIQTGQISVFQKTSSGGRSGRSTSSTEPMLVDLDYSQGMGALAGYSYADLFYCSSDIEVQGGSLAGGLVGVNQGRLVGCTSAVSIESVTHRVGGLVGINAGRVMSCSSTGSIEGNVVLGGLVAQNEGWISDCYSDVSVDGQTCGGLVGNNGYGIIDRCYSRGDESELLVAIEEYTDPQETLIWTGSGLELGHVVAVGRIRNSFHIIDDAAGIARDLEEDELLASEAQDVNGFLLAGWDFDGEVANGTSDYWVMGPNCPQLRILQEPYGGSLKGRVLTDDPILIDSPSQLGRIWEQPYADYQLQADLDLSGMAWSQAVVPWFAGTFDGDGHCLDGLCIKGVHQLGLFGLLESTSSVFDLSLESVDVNGVYDPTETSRDEGNNPTPTQIVTVSTHYVGALAGLNQGVVHDVSCTSVVKGHYIVGGLVGCNEQSMSRCQARAMAQGEGSIGGLMGKNVGEVVECLSKGSVMSEDSAGGLVGNHFEGIVVDCYSHARVSGGAYVVGGVVGVGYEDSLVLRCYTSDTQADIEGDNYWGDVEDCPGNADEARELETLLNKGWDFVGMEVRGSGGSGRSRNVGRALGSEGVWVWVPDYYPRLTWEGGDPNQVYSGGSGTSNDPYQIANIDDLLFLSDSPQDWDKHFILTADLDLTGMIWTEALIAPAEEPYSLDDFPWPRGGVAFDGSFNGNGHVIRNLTINGIGGLGLFGFIYGDAAITNLGLENVHINGNGNGMGALVGVFYGGAVAECYSVGQIEGERNVGGLVGIMRDEACLQNCYSSMTVLGGFFARGLVGFSEGAVSFCYSTGPVQGLISSRGGSGNAVGEYFFDGYWEQSGTNFEPYYDGNVVSDMVEIQTYLQAGWDFMGEADHGLHEIWQMPAEGGFPVLTVFQENNPFTPVGSGTIDDPFVISTAEQLGAVRQRPDSDYRLGADLDLEGITWYSAVVPELWGHFDGQGHTIKNLTLVGWDYLGLFGTLYEEAEVQRLGVIDVNISGAMEWQCPRNCYWVMEGGYDCGAIAGGNEGMVANCYATGVINGLSDLGGLVGTGPGSLTNCYSIVTIQSDDDDAKGVGGSSQGTVSCFWDTEATGILVDDGATGLTTTEMQDINTYLNAGWDFVEESDNGTEDIWVMPEEPGYPVLRQE